MIRILVSLFVFASAAAVIPRFFVIGFTHIFPQGCDHILFILGLFFLSRNFGVLLFQMTLFTLAHSLTLGLSIYGILSVPTPLVEIAIALSIAFIAGENLFGEHLSRWRPTVVFISGLIHGLGFAHSFRINFVKTDDIIPALFSFNLGIECGQLVVVVIAFVGISGVLNRTWYPTKIARPASFAIAASGLYWAVERIF